MTNQREIVDLEPVRIWLGLILGLILLIVAVGGITRLTESGLSMVTWEPIFGTVPPFSEAEWERRFDQYKQFPEYQQLRPDMTMEEFKFIFFWEYFHRLLGRLLGIAYALPLAWFWIKGKVTAPLKPKLLIGLLLGGAQGVMGWYMVKSGLVNDPYVSHFRLAAHLGLAFVVFGYLLWILLSIRTSAMSQSPASKPARLWAVVLSTLVIMQIVWGALVAGLNAGYFYNTFPTMQGHWIPPYWDMMQPLWSNFLHNPVTVQWVHRILGMVLLALTLTAWLLLRKDVSIEGEKRLALHWFACLMLVQFWLGVFTLILAVPIALGVMHQVTACLIVGVGVWLNFTFSGRQHA